MYQKLIERRDELGLTNKDIEEHTQLSTRTVARIFSKNEKDHKRGCGASTLRPVLNYLGLTFEELFEDSGMFILPNTTHTLQAKIDELTAENTKLKASELALLLELEKLKAEMHHKDEMLEMHKEYMKLLSKK